MLTGFLRRLKGTVRFSAEGGSVGRFLSLSGRAGVPLWNIREKNGVTYAETRARSFPQLRRPAEMTGTRLQKLRESGLPFRLRRYRKRAGIAVGVALFFTVIWVFSSFVWNVQISGNRRVSTGEIGSVLSSLGVRPGAVRMSVDLQRVENEALIRLPDLSWMAINIRGGTAFVEVKERVYPPQVVPLTLPCNIRASRTGQIVQLQVYEGMPMVRLHDSVKQGDLLVSGIVEEKNDVQRVVHASAKVVARTSRTLTQTVPLRRQQQVFTAPAVSRRTLLVGGSSLPLSFSKAPQGRCLRTARETPLLLWGVPLPLTLRTETYRPYTVKTVTVSAAQAFREAQQKLGALEKLEFAGTTLLSRRYTRSQTASGVTIRGDYTCDENIAYETPISLR